MSHVVKNYKKDKIAAELLETALELYSKKQNGFAVIHLAAACEEVLSGMIKGKREPGKFPPLSNQTAREKSIAGLMAIHHQHGTERSEKEIGGYLNWVRNQTKHHNPNSDPDELALCIDLEVESVLYRAIENYVLHFGSPTESMVRFMNDEYMKSSNPQVDTTHVNIKLLVVQSIGIFIVFAAALFLPAGTILWLAGWVFLVLFFGFYLAVTLWLFRHNPGLLQERTRFWSSDQQGWDKIVFPLLQVFCFAGLILMSLDAARFHWSPLPAWLQLAGAIVLVCSFYLFFLTFRENTYLSPVVHIQKERGHAVVSTGPYHYVRHPMYSAMCIFFVGTPLLLGSEYGVLFGLFLIVAIAWRAVMEERMLRKELPGYADYMTQVKYRLIPHVW